MRAPLLLAAALLLALPPLAPAQDQAHARPAALVLYDAASAPEGMPVPGTRFDGAALADAAPEGRPESALAHFREMQRHLRERSRTSAGMPLTLHAAFEGDALRATAQAEGEVELVLVEDLPDRRFLARARADGPEHAFPLDPSWDRGRLGVVAVARGEGGEALQAATWLAGQSGPTVQRAKAVLVEHATAEGCAPCAPRDEAYALLAAQAGGVARDAAGSYWRAPTLPALAGVALGLAAGGVLLGRRPA